MPNLSVWNGWIMVTGCHIWENSLHFETFDKIMYNNIKYGSEVRNVLSWRQKGARSILIRDKSGKSNSGL